MVEFFFLKGTLVQPKSVTGVSSCNNEEPRKVWGKTDNWFPIQPRKNIVNFVPASQRVEVLNLVEFFFLKGTLVQPKSMTGVSSCDTEGPWKVCRKLAPGFLFNPEKNM